MITQFYGETKIGKMNKTGATSVQLQAGSHIKLGGRGATLNAALNCDLSTNGFGGLDIGALAVLEKYYVYAVLNASTVGLVASLSAVSPLGFIVYKKVGAFYTDSSSEVIQTLNFGSMGRNIRCHLELSVAQTVPTAVNHFVIWDVISEDNADLFNGSTGIQIPEDGYYTLGGMATPYNLASEIHQVKIRTTNLFNVSVNTFIIPLANQETPQPCPRIERFLLKGDTVLMNVDAAADTSYNLRHLNGTYLSVSRTASPDDIDWT